MEAHYAYELPNSSYRDLAYLEQRGVTEFVHFTPSDNLVSILQNGLMPRKALKESGVTYAYTDNLRLDGRDVVNLSITNPNIKMFYRKRKELPKQIFVVLTLDPSFLIDVEGRYGYRSTNAASARSQPCNVEEVFSGDRPEFFEPSWPSDNQAEVLVKGSINPTFIKTIQFPYSSMKDPRTVTIAKDIASLARHLKLRCSVLFCDQHFTFDKSLLGQLEPKARYERFFISWSENEKAAASYEEAIRLIDKIKRFDCTAYAATALNNAIVEPNKDVDPSTMWTLRYRAPADPKRRGLEQLSALSVLEKIVNRGRKTRLSPDLERQLKTNSEIATAHQIQCALIELVKYQVIHPYDRISATYARKRQHRLTEIFRMALDDLQELSTNVCKLYRCGDPLTGIVMVDSVRDADFTMNWSDDTSKLRKSEIRVSNLNASSTPLPFDFIRVTEPVRINPNARALRFLLRYIFRFDDFREGQLEAILKGLRRQDAIVLLPTGSGKSIVFQLLALATPGIAFVVCPIISLIEDQITNLRQHGIDRVMGLSSAMDSGSRASVLDKVTAGQYLICYVSPERFQNRSFNANVKRFATTNIISTVAVDEAHCVSEWGHEFRTAYLGLARTCRQVCSTGRVTPPLLALTGTASTSVLTDMMNDLEIHDKYSIIQPSSFDRPEIHYRIIRVPSNQKLEALNQVVESLVPIDFQSKPQTFYKPNGSQSNCGIIFCCNVNGNYGLMASDKQIRAGHLGVWDFMESHLPGLCSYYAGSAPKRIATSDSDWNLEKRAQAASFKRNETTVMVATKAFGMGIDKPNVRWVVHFGMPGSIESYYQEVGRAARDRKIAFAYLLLSDDHHDLNEELLDPSRTSITDMKLKDLSAKGKWSGDDVSRVAYFHTNTFEGVERELQIANDVLNACDRDNWHQGHWHVNFMSCDKEHMERAIYRFRLLGVFDGYAIDYDGRGGTFVIKPSDYRGNGLRNHIIKCYVDYIKAYQPDEAYLKTAKSGVLEVVSGAVNDRDFILRAMRHLLGNFVYKVLEEGRRRAAKTMLDAANIAADAGGGDATDREFRRQMLAYLSAGSQRAKGNGIKSLLNNATNLELINEIIQHSDRSELLWQSSRLLEDYPEHYGLHFIQAAIHALNGDVARFKASLRAMAGYGTGNYGLSLDECEVDFIAFLDNQVVDLSAEAIESLLPAMSECFERDADELLSLMSSPQASILKDINTFYKIAMIAQEGLQWIQTK